MIWRRYEKENKPLNASILKKKIRQSNFINECE